MNSNQSCGRIRIICSDEHGPAAGCTVTMIDSRGTETGRKKTDAFGCAELPVLRAEEYCIRVQAKCCDSPAAQRRWFHLSPESRCECSFVFNRPFHPNRTGALRITLRDINYPEYTLSKGVYTLWQIF